MMTFGEAIEAAKSGARIARHGWNGRGMWVCFMPAQIVPADKVTARTNAMRGHGGALIVGAYFVMWTADATWQPGWLASQTDMLSEDWEVLP